MGRLSLRVGESRGVAYGDGQDERSQMHAMSLLVNTCSGMMKRVFIVDGARWILQGDEQAREIRTAGVEVFYSMLAATTLGRAKELVKQGFSDLNGMIAFGRIRERFGKTAGVAKLSECFSSSGHPLTAFRTSG